MFGRHAAITTVVVLSWFSIVWLSVASANTFVLFSNNLLIDAPSELAP